MTKVERDAEYMEQPAKRWEFKSLADQMEMLSITTGSLSQKIDILIKSQVTAQYVDEKLKMHLTAVDDKMTDHRREIDAKYSLIRTCIVIIAGIALTAMVTTALTWLAQGIAKLGSH